MRRTSVTRLLRVNDIDDDDDDGVRRVGFASQQTPPNCVEDGGLFELAQLLLRRREPDAQCSDLNELAGDDVSQSICLKHRL